LGGPELRADWLNIGIADEIEDSVLDPPFISEHGCSHANSFDLALARSGTLDCASRGWRM